jgi:hypothetical protein
MTSNSSVNILLHYGLLFKVSESFAKLKPLLSVSKVKSFHGSKSKQHKRGHSEKQLILTHPAPNLQFPQLEATC